MIVTNQGYNVELKDVKIIEEEQHEYFLNVTYEYETETGVYEMNIPWIKLPINKNKLPAFTFNMGNDVNGRNVDLGFGDVPLLYDPNDKTSHSITKIKNKPRKMTLSEIEKALGYEIELVK